MSMVWIWMYLVDHQLLGVLAQSWVDGGPHAEPAQIVQVFERFQDAFHDGLHVDIVSRLEQPGGQCQLPDAIVVTMSALHQCTVSEIQLAEVYHHG